MSVEVGNPKRQEIDIITYVKRLWNKKSFVLKVTVAFMLMGTFLALFSPKQYTADCVIVPQSTKRTASSSLTSLAAMAGINLGDMSGVETLSPRIFHKVLDNADYQKELMYTKVHFSKWEEPITLLDYFTNKKYQSFSLLGFVKKYTIGLPGTIISAIKGKPVESDAQDSTKYQDLRILSRDEARCAKILSKLNRMTINDKEGYLTLITNMSEPIAAAEVNTAAYNLLQKYVTDFKLGNARSNLSYVTARYNEAKVDFEKIQIEYASFLDANRVITSAVAKTKRERLRSEYEIASTLYTELAKQMLQAELRVKEDTPAISAVKPTVVPDRKSKPRRAQMMILWTVVGFIISCCTVIVLDYLKKIGSDWPKQWTI